MKLNLGCGQNWLPDFINVDKFELTRAAGEPVTLHDLEVFPWPWPAGAVDVVMMNHVLEHLGRDPDVFMGIMRELYRVCAPDAQIFINVPHPRHDHFIGDPTHVRVVTPEVLSLFSKKHCARWAEMRAANSPLALYHDVDFELIEQRMILDGRWADMFDKGLISAVKLDEAMRQHNNVVKEIRIVLRVVKATREIDVTPIRGPRESITVPA